MHTPFASTPSRALAQRPALVAVLLALDFAGHVLWPAPVQAQASDAELTTALRGYIDAGRWSDGLRIVERSAESESPELLALIAQVQSATLQPATAAKTLERALRFSPEDGSLALEMAWAHYTAQNFDAAREALALAVRLKAEQDAVDDLDGQLRFIASLDSPQEPLEPGTPAHLVRQALDCFDTCSFARLTALFTGKLAAAASSRADLGDAKNEAFLRGMRKSLWAGWGAPEERQVWIDPETREIADKVQVGMYFRPKVQATSMIERARRSQGDDALLETLPPDVRAVASGLSPVDLQTFLTRLPYALAPVVRLIASVEKDSHGRLAVADVMREDGTSLTALAAKVVDTESTKSAPLTEGDYEKITMAVFGLIALAVWLARR